MTGFLGWTSWRYENTCFPHGDRMAPFVFLRVLSTLGLQLAQNGCYTGTSIATFHSVLPFHSAMLVVTSDYAISLCNTPVPPDFLPIFPKFMPANSVGAGVMWNVKHLSIPMQWIWSKSYLICYLILGIGTLHQIQPEAPKSINHQR